jgi:hypothetical protein
MYQYAPTNRVLTLPEMIPFSRTSTSPGPDPSASMVARVSHFPPTTPASYSATSFPSQPAQHTSTLPYWERAQAAFQPQFHQPVFQQRLQPPPFAAQQHSLSNAILASLYHQVQQQQQQLQQQREQQYQQLQQRQPYLQQRSYTALPATTYAAPARLGRNGRLPATSPYLDSPSPQAQPAAAAAAATAATAAAAQHDAQPQRQHIPRQQPQAPALPKRTLTRRATCKPFITLQASIEACEPPFQCKTVDSPRKTTTSRLLPTVSSLLAILPYPSPSPIGADNSYPTATPAPDPSPQGLPPATPPAAPEPDPSTDAIPPANGRPPDGPELRAIPFRFPRSRSHGTQLHTQERGTLSGGAASGTVGDG